MLQQRFVIIMVLATSVIFLSACQGNRIRLDGPDHITVNGVEHPHVSLSSLGVYQEGDWVIVRGRVEHPPPPGSVINIEFEHGKTHPTTSTGT